MATHDGSKWESMTWKRRLEMSGPDGRSIPIKGADGEASSIWYVRLARKGFRAACPNSILSMPGELTDRGRETSLAFGKSLRQLYVDQLNLVRS